VDFDWEAGVSQQAKSLRRGYKLVPLAVLILYTVATIVMTWPLAAQLSTHAAGSGNDMWVPRWNHWWLRKALTEGYDPYYTPYLFYPQGVSLLWHSFSWLNTGLWFPIQALVGPLAAQNVVVLLAYILSGYTMYLLTREITGSRKAAFVAGLVYAFFPYRQIHRNQIKFLSAQWVPLFALYLVRLTRKGRLRDGLKAGGALALCGLSGVQLMVLGGMWGVLWLAYAVIAERSSWSRRTALALLLGGFVCAAILAPFYAPLVVELWDPTTEQDLTTGDTGEGGGTDAIAYFVPSRYHYLLRSGPLKKLYKQVVHMDGSVAAIGYTALGLGIWAIVKRWRKTWFWGLSALVFASLALGQTARLNGWALTGLPTPYGLIAPTLLGETVRHPSRFNLILALPVAVMVAIGLADVLDRFRRRLVWAGVVTTVAAVLVLFEYISPFYTTEPIQSTFFDQLREERGAFAVADFPIGFHAHDKWYMYAQTIHGRPMVGGHVSRVPAGAQDFMDSVPLLNAARTSPPQEGELGDITHQLEPLAEADVRYVIVHKYRTDADNISRWREWFAFQPCYEDAYLLAFRTTPRYGEDFEFATELGDGIGLLEASISAQEVGQGGSLDVMALWGTRDAPRRDWLAYVALVDSTGHEAQVEDFEPFAGWPTSEWGEAAVVRGRWTLQVSPYMPSDTYTVILGLTDPATGERLGEPVALGQLDVQAMGRVFEAPTVEVESEAVFGTVLRLLGYDLGQEDDQMTITLHWKALKRMDVAYKFFVHLVDPESGQLVAQADVMPYSWTYPTFWWEAGEVVSDEIGLSLTDVPPGSYRLEIGTYDPDTGERLALTEGRGPQQPADRLVLPDVVEVR
jgi:hypothetical protein